SGLRFESRCKHMQAVAAVPSPGPPSVGGCQKTCTVRSPIDPWGGYRSVSLGVPSPCASEVLSVGAAATTSLVPAFLADSSATSQTAQLSFTLDSGVSSCFFSDCTDITPLRTPVTIAFADPTVGPPHLHDLGFVTTFPLDEPVATCTVDATGVPLATFHREPGSGLPKSLAPLPRSHAPPCTPCVEGRQRAIPHSSSFPPTTAPFYTLHLDVWGPSPVRGPRHERYFLIVVDNYSRYTTVLPLRRKADVPTVFKPWLLARGDA
ncbi:unnamed protein product, partial [Closterium sp. NIES-54]